MTSLARTPWAPVLATVILALPACVGARKSPSASAVVATPTAGKATAENREPNLAAATALTADGHANGAAERLIIRNAELRMRVSDVDAAETALKAKVSDRDGYVLSAEKTGSGDGAILQVTFRVPAEQFDRALADVSALAKVVDTKKVTGQDVTEEYVDLEAQVRNLEATRARLLTFLDKAVKVDDALAVQRALTDIQGQIERIAGRMKYLRQNAALSTITVSIYSETTTRLVSPEGWRPGETGRVAIRGLVGFAQFLADAAIVIGIWAPVWGPIGIVVWWARRRRKAKASSAP